MTIDNATQTRFRFASALRALCAGALLLTAACDDVDGGPCEYEAVDQYEGVITSVERASNEADAPFLVQIEIAHAEEDDVQSMCELRVDSSEADKIDSAGIDVGRKLTLDLMENTKGACVPETFEVRDLELMSLECY